MLASWTAHHEATLYRRRGRAGSVVRVRRQCPRWVLTGEGGRERVCGTPGEAQAIGRGGRSHACWVPACWTIEGTQRAGHQPYGTAAEAMAAVDKGETEPTIMELEAMLADILYPPGSPLKPPAVRSPSWLALYEITGWWRRDPMPGDPERIVCVKRTATDWCTAACGQDGRTTITGWGHVSAADAMANIDRRPGTDTAWHRV